MDMFRDTLHLPVETPENPFVTPANIHTIEAFMNRVGYQGVFNKVSALIHNELWPQPWHTMFTKYSKAVQQQELLAMIRQRSTFFSCFMLNSPNIPKRLEEDYHSIKDDVPLVSVNTTGNVLVRGMLILDVLLTVEIIEMDDFKEITPSAHRSPTISASPLVTKKRKQIAGESSSPQKSLKITIKQKQIVEKDYDDYEDRIEPGSHKDNPKVVDDDDDKEKEIRKHFQELTDIVLQSNYLTSKLPQVRKDFPVNTPSSRALRQAVRRQFIPQIAENVTDDIIEANLKPCIVNTIIEDRGAFRSQVPNFVSKEFKAHAPAIIEELFKNHEADFHSHHDEHSNVDAPPKGVKRRVKEQQCQKIKEWVHGAENVVDEDEVISEDVTLELITEFQNIDKRVPTIFDQARMEATFRDSLSNMSRNAKEYAYHLEQSTSFMKISKEPDLEEKLNRWVQKEFKTFNEDARLSIQHWKDS
ncbi:hypothetical protein Tco_1192198 [Tanacetum coccineum]